jgi:hypothetical protein
MMRWGMTAATVRRSADHQHPQYLFTALARLEPESRKTGNSTSMKRIHSDVSFCHTTKLGAAVFKRGAILVV